MKPLRQDYHGCFVRRCEGEDVGFSASRNPLPARDHLTSMTVQLYDYFWHLALSLL